MKSVRHLKFSLLILFGIIGLGTGGYWLIEGWPLFDSLYMTVITLATVGFKEVHELSDKGRAFTLLLILFGAGIIAYAIGSMIRFTVEGELRTILGRKKLENQIRKLQGHYIICGFGRIGTHICNEFRSRPSMAFVVVEKDLECCEKMAANGVLFVHGDATDDDTLLSAGIRKAKGLITVVTSDTENVYITLTARGLNPDLFILARASDPGSEKKLRRAGATKVISPYTIGASRMAQAVLRPSVVDFIEIATAGHNLELQLEEIPVAPGSRLVNTSLINSGIRRDWNIIIIGIKKADGKMLFNPVPTVAIESGDTLITLGEQPSIQHLEKIASGITAGD
jgi:voltage-gated potassium channel